MSKNLFRLLPGLSRDTRGNVAAVFALAALPVIGVGGVAYDHSRAFRVQSDLQYSVDAAALAGATEVSDSAVSGTVDSFMAANLADSMEAYDVSYEVEIATDTITVTAEAVVPTTLASLFMDAVPVSASATAFHGPPVRLVELEVTNFNSDAADANYIYWYIVPEDGGEPAEEDLHLFLSNDPNNPAPEIPDVIRVGVNQQIGYALFNVTGGITPYGNNSYGQPPGTVNKSYSHLEPDNLQPAGNSDCSYGPVEHAWDDNGGGVDDNDFNDAVYQFSCTAVQTDPTTVYLLR